MKNIQLLVIAFLIVIQGYGQIDNCGSVINDTFDEAGALPAGWIEYNTSGRVTVESGKLKFNHNTTKPSAQRTFDPTSNNSFFTFDVSASRNSVNCQIHLVSSTGKYLSSIAIGIGTATIKYATAMQNGVPSNFVDGSTVKSFSTNTVFTLASQIDFTSKKVNFYNNGELVFADVPFLEDAEDTAKIDIQLIYMYANNGQFYFDNIALINGGEEKLSLKTEITNAENVIESAIVGTNYGEYSQASLDTFNSAIDDAKSTLENCDANASDIQQAISQLNAAQDVFTASSVNDPVLKMYAGYNFSGDKREIYCGYYNGNLESYDNFGVSFTLEKGYMATFAEDVNGLGFSKVYIAQDEDLEINLPTDLQQSISFIRVSPWYPVAKKGSLGADIKWSSANNYNTTWHYSWGLSPNAQVPDVEFVPMSWSTGDNWTSLAKMKEVGENMKFNHLLAFNEPDNSGQSNLTVEEALAAYPKLLASGLRIGAPGVENVQYSANNDSFNENSWIKRFMDSCVVRGYRVDFIPAHDYVRRSSSTFIERFKALHDRYDLPVWVTEYNYGNPNFGSANLTLEQGYNNIKSLTEALEAADFVERYNWYYFFGANTGIGGITNGVLNITGQFYRDLQSQNPSYSQEVYEQGTLRVNNFDENQSNIMLYPNPVTSSIFTVDYGNLSTSNDIDIKLFTIYGKEIMTKKGVAKQIDISSLNNGVYLVNIVSENINITKKIIINRKRN
ncbi:glycosyl hydrolase [uncultured Polaribacter sp.]|uniref:glycosyl hydrolase n=1 Tax=uncultured Polaribacter sp. TaxID=174711 RepID=UPI00260964BD|nr:glycosyl hydrolase [uncultured Polaribacter sp.]